jgi:hypothetical protein
MGEEFRFPKLIVQRIYEEDGRRFRESVTSPICDFCLDERVKWTYECEDFSLNLSREVWASHNGWAACEECSQLVEDRSWIYLINRVWRAKRDLGIEMSFENRLDSSEIVFGFSDHFTPGRKAFG